ncbi:MAG: FtsW/RodA/SpoVE family cell cycle protein [Paludibacteraceae bacterium]|nr:FtsW/RodA/SpoVE family cell cycle protein [Paludibacteraceae bacterium]
MKNNLTHKIRQQCQYVDRVYWLLFGLLIIVAILALFSASSTLAFAHGNTLSPILNQMLFICAGVLVAFIVQFIPSHYIRICGYIGLLISIGMLLLTYAGMGVTINGATRWLRIGGIVFQPSELAKLTLIIVVADLLSRIKNKDDEKKYFFIVLGITGFVCLLILFNNLSTTLLLGGIVFLLFFLARVHIKYWGSVLLITIGLLVGGYFLVKEVYVKPGRQIEASLMQRAITWVNRVDAMVEEFKAPGDSKQSLEENYQRTIAKVAIAHGGASPVGVLPGNSTERDFLPQAFADYIFAIIVEESGLIGSFLLMLLYLSILFRSCLISSKYADYSAMLMVMGLALMLTCQALVSMMVSVGIGPVTGQPLPLISRGGTSALVTSLYFGIIMCVAREQNELRIRQQRSIVNSQKDVPDINLDD